MINFNKVTLKNFKSFGNKPQTINLNDTGTTLITANNEDSGEKGSSGNGAGKSSSLAAITFALYNKDLDKLKPDEMINLRNGKEMLVTLEFSIGNHEYKIIRGRKPNILEFYEDDVSLTRDSMKNTDIEIQRVIGISYDVFMSVFFANPFKETFMSMGSAAQRNFMEDILSLDTLAERAEALKNIRKDLKVDIRLAEQDLSHVHAMREKEKESLEKLKQQANEHDEATRKNIEENKEVLDELGNIDFDALIKKADSVQSTESLDVKLKSLYAQGEGYIREIDGLESTISLHEKSRSKVDTWETEHKERLEKLQEDVDNAPSIEDIEKRNTLISQIEQGDQESLRLSDQMRKINSVEIPTLDEQADNLGEEYLKLESGECPYCHQSHTDDERMDAILAEFASIEEKKGTLDGNFKRLEEEQLTLHKNMDEKKGSLPDIPRDTTANDVERLTERLQEEKEKTNPYDIDEGEIERLKASVSELEALAEEHAKEAEGLVAELNKIKEENEAITSDLDNTIGTSDVGELREMKTTTDSIHKEIERLDQSVNPYNKQIKEFPELTSTEEAVAAHDHLVNKEKHATYLIKLLTDPKSFIRKNIVDQYVPYLNKKIVEYTQYLDLPHVAEINADMSVDVEYMTKTVSYFTLSRGERLRLDLATTLAFRDLLKLMGRETNLMLIDEVLDSALDRNGTTKTFNLIRKYIDNVLLISHREEFKEMVDDVMVITKRNGFSIINE